MTGPVLGLALGRRPPAEVLPLLLAISDWCRPITLDPDGDRPVAVLATAAPAERLPRGVPIALWTRSPDEMRSPVGAGAAAIVSDVLAIVEAAGPRGVYASSGHHAMGRRPVPPFVRERLRRARGLPAVSLLEQRSDGWWWTGREEPLPEDLLPTAMACASAVVAGEPERVLESLAWGAPCVCDAGSAGLVGAVPQTHVLVADGEVERSALATRLASDPELAARMSWAGRRLVERRHDTGWCANRLVELLFSLSNPHPMVAARFQLRLLGTPAGARIADRFIEATDQLAPRASGDAG